MGVMTKFHQRNWEWEHYLTNIKGEPVHSVYIMDRFGAPHYSWFHGTDTKIHLVSLDPVFARATFKHPLPMQGSNSSSLCGQIIDDIQSGRVLPEYVLLTESDSSPDGVATFKLCVKALESLEKGGKKLYTKEKSFVGDLVPLDFKTMRPRQ